MTRLVVVLALGVALTGCTRRKVPAVPKPPAAVPAPAPEPPQIIWVPAPEAPDDDEQQSLFNNGVVTI